MKDSQRKAMFAKANKGKVIYDSSDGKYKINGIPIHKGQKSLEEKEKLIFLEPSSRSNDYHHQVAHHVGTHTANKIDWRNMNRELHELDLKQEKLDDKMIHGSQRVQDRALAESEQLQNHFSNVRWHKYSHLNSNTEAGVPLKHNDKEVKVYS